ncbi:Glucuronosyltransferase [Aphelenchoides besseyi]|nr:Glucuronosyltransferase [Aphelenchoides besseyi]KAI6224209.1 Glucuronosyltransferase [Aphelenchoides besseyi]
MEVLAIFFILITSFDYVNGLKFLVYNSRVSRSHVIYMGKLADELAKAGHEVINYQPIVTKDFNETGVKYARTITRELSYENDFDQRFMHEFIWSNETIQDWIKALRYGAGGFTTMFVRTCGDQLRDKKMMERLKAENFDLALLEYFDPCSLGLLEVIGLKKYIAVYSMPLSSLAASFIGLPSTHSFVPDVHSTSTSKMTFFERLKNLFMGLVFFRYFSLNAFICRFEEVIKREVNSNFDYTERAGEAEFVFVNADSLLDYPRPISSKVVYIGGMGIDQRHVSPLSSKYQEIFNKSKRGVVFFSLGTVAPSFAMPNHTKRTFLDAFAEFKDVIFLWKYEKPEHEIAKDYANVIAEPWFPQRDLLRQEKLLLFLTHAGANSIAEATHAGVPLLTLPLFADQKRNAKMIEHKGIGLSMDKTKLTKEYIVDHLKQIIDNESFRLRAKEIAEMLANKPEDATETMVKHAVFAAKFNVHEHLDMEGRKMSFITYYNCDVFVFLIGVFVVSIYVLYGVFWFAISCYLRRKKSKSE